MTNSATSEIKIEAEIQQMVNDTKTAKVAGANGWLNGEPQVATVYRFCVMHTDYNRGNDYDMAEAIDRADDFWKNNLMSEYVAAWCDANNVLWGTIEIIGKAVKYNHGTEGNYHYCFRALVTLRDKE